MHTWQNNRLRESAENAKKPHWASAHTCSIAQKWFAPGGSVRNILPLHISNEPYWGLPTKKRVVTPFMGLAWAKREEEGAENAKSDASRFCGRRLDWLVACCQGRRSRKNRGLEMPKEGIRKGKKPYKGKWDHQTGTNKTQVNQLSINLLEEDRADLFQLFQLFQFIFQRVRNSSPPPIYIITN